MSTVIFYQGELKNICKFFQTLDLGPEPMKTLITDTTSKN